MANTKQAEKRARQNLKRRGRNRANRSKLRSQVKNFLNDVEGGIEAEKIRSGLTSTLSQIDKAVHKGILHRNTASRKKSNLTRRANQALSTAG
jgi:small subunit ribosomal protein S20